MPATGADRRLRAFLVNTDTGESTDVVVSLTRGKVVSARTLDPAKDGQLPIMDSDFALVEEITKADPDWRAAMARRGYHDLSKIRTCPITAGVFGRAPRTTGGGWSGCSPSSRPASTTWPGRTRSTASPPTWT